MPTPPTYADLQALIERHLDEAHRHLLRSATDPGRSLPRFKTKSEQLQDQRGFNVLLALLTAAQLTPVTSDELRQASYERIDGALLAAEDTKIRRRLQGIPETAPDLSGSADLAQAGPRDDDGGGQDERSA
jgi:phage I-like protein